MLMFGNEYDIVRHFPEYFLDYREEMDSAIRWTDRLQSSSGEWSLLNVIAVRSVHSNFVKIHSTCCKLSGMLYYKKYLSYCTVVPKIKCMGKTVKK